MENKKGQQGIDKYADDITTIKSILMKVEEKPILEYWAFYTWGGFILIGTALHYLFRSYYLIPIEDLLFRLWVPVMLISSLFEIIAWVKKMSKESLPLFTRLDIKFWLNMLGSCIVVSFLIFILLKTSGMHYLPIFVQLFFGMFMLFYAQMSHFHLYIYSFFLIITGIIYYYIGLNIELQFYIVGLTLGITFILSGVSAYFKEKKQNG